MRRRAFLGLVLAAPTVAAVGVPTLAWGGPRPVPPAVTRIPLTGVSGSALRAAGSGGPLALTDERETAPFSLLGVTWLPDPAVDVAVRVRTRTDGRWTPWRPVPVQGDHRPDDVETPELREGTVPFWAGPSDAVQVRVDRLGGPRPRDLRVELVDPGSSPADDLRPRGGLAFAEEPRPTIITRQQWGADESIRRGSPSYNSTVKVGFVHHTAGTNDYTPEQAAAVVRGVYAYHVKSNGWSDIGYNYLVDRFGRAYEGRAGGLDRFVVGAHTGGFNRDSFAVSLLGDFSTLPPSPETLSTVSDLLAWKLGTAYREPLATAALTSAGGGTSKYSAGSTAEFDVISGHRDAGNTSCPGSTVYAELDAIRAQAGDKLGAGFVDPVLTGGEVHARGSRGPVTLSASTRGPLQWTATVGDSAGNLLRTASGATLVDGDLAEITWDLTDAAGEPVRPGTYVLRLTGSGAGDRALPYAKQVVVKGEPCRGAPLQRARCKARRGG